MSNRLKEQFLLFRIRAKNDADAFGEIYDLYVARIHRFIFFKVSSTEQAEDLTSETFLKAWQYLKEKRDVPHLQALLFSIARSVVIDFYRSAALDRSKVSLEDERTMDIPDARAARLLTDIDINVDMERVLAKLRGLKDEYREVIIMKYIDDMDASEIASAVGKTASTVRVLLHRAVRALSDALTNELQPTHNAPARAES